MSQTLSDTRLQALMADVAALRAESDIRRLISRYAFLCDTPLPDPTLPDDDARVEAIVDLYAPDAVWEGVGEYYDNQFGQVQGHDGIRAHFRKFWARRNPSLVLNCHYMTSEQIHVHGDEADGQWVHFQPWIFSDGTSVLRSSRLNNRFRMVDGVWKIARYRTENVFIAPLPQGWAESFPSRSDLMK
ncbi:nuclear transport factor 2 family protein [Komagataeibacter xylinus]|uniref:Nuclear transport factor 2 family protein n=1 Tax=Komagataeibacter xylinus TaxID=28448 RepID=A0A857FNW6_KOMXY|nr:nuclear transport factor 2 family protein [Komagataeibacter xylinus]QHC35991.1 nuclear transport factor 2 family protein [Komagataeibacter xylinus]